MLVVFDWDGTILDSTDKIVRSMQIAAEQVGLPVLEADSVKQIIGLGLREAICTLYPLASAEQVENLREGYSSVYVKEDAKPCPFYPGVEDTLLALKNDGFHLAIATGKSRGGLNRVLSNLDMLDFFDASRCADETASKPHPLMLHELLAHFSVSPESACMVGDTSFDLEMAQNAGMHSVGVSYGAHDVDVLERFSPAAIIDSMMELPNVLPIVTVEE